MIQKICFLALAGALGTLARAGLSALIQRALGPRLPLGTVTVNLLGCFVFGLIAALAAEGSRIGPELRLVLLVGFLGAFTTFSSFVNDTVWLAGDARWGAAALNMLGQNVLGVASFWLGARLAASLS